MAAIKNREQRENAEPAERGAIPGCWTGMFFSVDIYQNLLLRKMLGERRNSDSGVLKTTEVGIDKSLAKTDRRLQAEDKADLGAKASDKNLLRRLNPLEIYKKYRVFKQRTQQPKLRPSARRLSRTISIHHLECNDYVLSDQNQSEQEESSLRLDDRRRLDILRHRLERQISERCSPVGFSERPALLHFNRSSSYPRRARESQHFEDVKQRKKDVMKENAHISLDGILHKAPCGSTPSREIRHDKFSLLEDPDACKISSSMRRSMSLTDSLEKYSQLLKSNFDQESRSSKIFGRISSLPNFDSRHFSEDNHMEISPIFSYSQSISLEYGQEETAVCDEADISRAENAMNSINEREETEDQDIPRSVSEHVLLPRGSEMKSENSEEHEYADNGSQSGVIEPKVSSMPVVELLKQYWPNSELSETNLSLIPKLDDPICANVDQELVNDLTHEVLQEILESSCGMVSMKPLTSILRHAWDNISWHLDSHQEADDRLEYILERDFKKDLGWMKLGSDVEDVGLDLEALILDDLMEEVFVDFSLISR